MIAVVLLLVMPLSGCAVAIRLLAAAEGLSAVGELLDAVTDPATEAEPVAENQDIHAVVGGTRGAGLRLNGRPGADRLAVFPDGTVVTVYCRTNGPQVNGAYASTSTWISVGTADGRSGFMSSAYVALDHAAEVPPC